LNPRSVRSCFLQRIPPPPPTTNNNHTHTLSPSRQQCLIARQMLGNGPEHPKAGR
jgi:hypothetical protein